MITVSLAAVSISLFHTAGLAHVFDFADVLVNRAIAASPRAIEAFPQLSRSGSKLGKAPAQSVPKNPLTDVVRNRALANSPRALEQFPELLRPEQFPGKGNGTGLGSQGSRNRAIGNSPRTLEEFPWLARREAGDSR